MQAVLAIIVLAIVASAYAFGTEFEILSKGKVSNVKPEGRIINGKPVAITEHPYQVGLITGGNWCGGSLISNVHILTAAHCVDGVAVATIRAFLGSATREGGIVLVPTSKKVHEGWSKSNGVNDIALLRIPTVQYSSSIRNIALPSTSDSSSYSGYTAVATGWGITESGNYATQLRAADLKVITNSECIQTYGSSIKSSNLCVSTLYGVSTCNGDSGGPLVQRSKGYNILVGVTSFGFGAGCYSGSPAVFTRVTSYRSWIREWAGV